MFGKRSDGKKIKGIEPLMQLVPYVMYNRNDAMVMIYEDIDCAKMDTYIREKRPREYSYMHILIAAMVRTVYYKPILNRFVMNGKLYGRDKINVAFSVHRSLRGDMAETIIKIEFEGTETLEEIARRIDEEIEINTRKDETNGTDDTAKSVVSLPSFLVKSAVRFLMWLDRHNALPKAIIKISPFHTSFFITNLKSLGINTVFHHIYNFGTTGQFISMGKERYMPVVVDKNRIEIKKIMRLGIVVDERICDGLYFARATKMMKKFIHSPQLMEQPAEKIQ